MAAVNTYVRGFTAATAATADHTIAELWNPHATRSLTIWEISIYKAGAGTANDSIYLRRSTAKGTSGSTATPAAPNTDDNRSAPPTGATLELAAFTVQPTLAALPAMYGWVAPAVAGAGITLPTPRGIIVPAGAGLCIVQRAATIWPTSEVTFVFGD
jgi:hypothetical protein